MEDVVGKIKKLLRLGESPNANEAAAAIAKAQSLMERHRIDAAMLALDKGEAQEEEEIRSFNDPLDPDNTGMWRGRLAVVLCRANACVAWRQRGMGLMIIGQASNANAVRYLYAYCTKEIDRLVRKYASGEGRAWGTSFRLGCIDAISKAIAAERARMREELRGAAGTKALMVINTAIAKVDQQSAAVEAWVQANMSFGRSRPSSARVYSSARDLGRQHGASIYPGRTSGALPGPQAKQITGGN